MEIENKEYNIKEEYTEEIKEGDDSNLKSHIDIENECI